MNQTLNQTLPASRLSGWGTPIIQPEIVSQSELRQIFDFQRQQEEIKDLIELVQRKMELRASIESGPMRVETVAQSVEVIDKTTLACFFGSDQVNALVQTIGNPPNAIKVVGYCDPLYPDLPARG